MEVFSWLRLQHHATDSQLRVSVTRDALARAHTAVSGVNPTKTFTPRGISRVRPAGKAVLCAGDAQASWKEGDLVLGKAERLSSRGSLTRGAGGKQGETLASTEEFMC